MIIKTYIRSDELDVVIKCIEEATEENIARWLKKPKHVEEGKLPEYKRGSGTSQFLIEVEVFEIDDVNAAGLVSMLLHTSGIMPIDKEFVQEREEEHRSESLEWDLKKFFNLIMSPLALAVPSWEAWLDLKMGVGSIGAVIKPSDYCQGSGKASMDRLSELKVTRRIIVCAIQRLHERNRLGAEKDLPIEIYEHSGPKLPGCDI